MGFFAIGDDPDVGSNAGVVKHLLRQSDDSFEPIIFDNPFANLTFPAACPTGEKGRAVKDDSSWRAASLLIELVKFANHVLQEKQRPIVPPAQAGPKATFFALLLVFVHYLLLLFLPVHAKRRVGQQVIELAVRHRIA